MTTPNMLILNDVQIQQKIKRIAYQIYESNSEETEIVMAGIARNGYLFAQKLADVIATIAPLKVILCKVVIDKKNPLLPVETDLPSVAYKNKSLVLVDDVLNSGTTLMYAVKHFLSVPLKQFKTAVLVNRNHKKYPVKADFKGISLSTSLYEHVLIACKSTQMKAYIVPSKH